MTKVVITRKDGCIAAFRAGGHASSLGAGRDIYCAAISAILQTAVVGLSDYAAAELDLDIADGELNCVIKTDCSRQDIKAITETMYLGLLSFSKENGRYIKLIEEVL